MSAPTGTQTTIKISVGSKTKLAQSQINATYVVEKADARLDVDRLRRKRRVRIKRERNLDLGLVGHARHGRASRFKRSCLACRRHVAFSVRWVESIWWCTAKMRICLSVIVTRQCSPLQFFHQLSGSKSEIRIFSSLRLGPHLAQSVALQAAVGCGIDGYHEHCTRSLRYTHASHLGRKRLSIRAYVAGSTQPRVRASALFDRVVGTARRSRRRWRRVSASQTRP